MSRRILVFYYAATALFLLLDLGYDLNVRLAFLEAWPGFRLLYYGVLFGCMGLMLWRPEWTTLIGTVESLFCLIALIVNMALSWVIVTDEMIETGRHVISVPYIANYIIAGGAAYLSWTQGINALTSRSRWR